MTYIIYPSTGEVLRMSDGKVIAPCQSTDDPDFVTYISWVNQGNAPQSEDPPAPMETPESVSANIVEAIQNHLDGVAKTRNYDGILSLCTYASSSIPRFRAEGQAGVDWRDQCWAAAYQIMADVGLGLRTIPTVAEVLAELPVIAW
jgi:hypothetical protein